MLRITLIVLLTVTLAVPLSAQEKPERVLRVYSVGSLVPRGGTPREGERDPQRAEFTLLGPMSVFRSRDDSVWASVPDRAPVAKSIVELLKSVGDPDGEIKVTVGGSGGQLLVRATVAQHGRIAKALEALHSAGEPFVIDVRHMVVSAAAVAADGKVKRLLGHAATGGLDEAALAAVDRNKNARGGTMHAPQGQWTMFRAAREVRYVPDFSVEIAQAAAIAQPILHVASEGIKVAVRPFLLQDGRAVLRVVASAGDLDPNLRRFEMRSPERTDSLRIRNTDYGIAEQTDYRGCAMSTELVLKTGATSGMLVARPDGNWHLLLLTLRKAPKPASAGTFLVLPAGALVAEDDEFGLQRASNDALWITSFGKTQRLGLDLLMREMRRSMHEDSLGFLHASSWLHGGSVVLHTKAEEAKAVATSMGALEKALVQPATLSIVLRNGTREIGTLLAPLVSGRRAMFTSYHRLDYIGEYQVEVAQESRIADPVEFVAYAGFFVEAQLFGKSPGSYRLRLALRVAAMPEGIRLVALETGGVPIVQSVPQRESATVAHLDMSPFKSQEIDLGRNPFGPGRLRASVIISDVRK